VLDQPTPQGGQDRNVACPGLGLELERARLRRARRRWLARCPGPGATAAEVAERTGVEVDLLTSVLEAERRRGRVWRDPLDGRYRLTSIHASRSLHQSGGGRPCELHEDDDAQQASPRHAWVCQRR
jgi:hypothetical protein